MYCNHSGHCRATEDFEIHLFRITNPSIIKRLIENMFQRNSLVERKEGD